MPVNNDYVMNLPQEYYSAIGEFMFRCGQLENQMQNVLWAAIDIDQKRGRVLTISAGAKAIRGMLATTISPEARERWIPSKEKTLLQEINSLVLKSREFADLRNKIAHGAWQYPVGGDSSNVRLMFTKERNEKIFARFDPALDDAYICRQCAKLKALNLKAKNVLIALFDFRGWPTSHLHSRKNVAYAFRTYRSSTSITGLSLRT